VKSVLRRTEIVYGLWFIALVIFMLPNFTFGTARDWLAETPSSAMQREIQYFYKKQTRSYRNFLLANKMVKVVNV